jgi:hypothetical protein
LGHIVERGAEQSGLLAAAVVDDDSGNGRGAEREPNIPAALLRLIAHCGPVVSVPLGLAGITD